MSDDGLRWWKSSRSGSQGGQCVEVASADNTWYVRDSKNPTDGILTVHSAQWRTFLDNVRTGAFTAGS